MTLLLVLASQANTWKACGEKHFDFWGHEYLFSFRYSNFRNAMLNPLSRPSKNTSPRWAKLSVLTKMASRRCALGTLCPATSSKFPVRFYFNSPWWRQWPPHTLVWSWCHCLRAAICMHYGPIATGCPNMSAEKMNSFETSVKKNSSNRRRIFFCIII